MSRPEQSSPDLRVAVPTLEPLPGFVALAGMAAMLLASRAEAASPAARASGLEVMARP